MDLIVDEIIQRFTHEIVLKAFQNEKRIRSRYGQDFVATKPAIAPSPAGRSNSGTSTPKVTRAPASLEIPGRVMYSRINGRDIYGNEKPTTTKYFECPNCHRKAASFRIASHIERCLSGRNSRIKNGRQLDSDQFPSPKKRKLEKSQVARIQEEDFSVSLPASRGSSPVVENRSMSEGP